MIGITKCVVTKYKGDKFVQTVKGHGSKQPNIILFVAPCIEI
jgi:hypothetical protein